MLDSRGIGRMLDMPISTLLKVLRNILRCYPYKITHVQQLLHANLEALYRPKDSGIKKWKLRKNSLGQFSSYFKQLCEQSLITGFPTIIATRTPWRKVVKIIVFVGCTCGFLYQTSEFLELYWAYPTMVDIKVENPDSVVLPAISFCNANRIRRKALCTMIPDDCGWFDNRSEFCTTYPKYCIPWEKDEDNVYAIPMFAYYDNVNRSREYVRQLGEKMEDIIQGCLIKTNSIFPCKNYVSVSWVDNDGYPFNCFTVETLWGQPDEEQINIPLEGKVSMLLNLQPEEYTLYYDLVLVHIGLHEAHGLGNPFREGIKLQAGRTYDIFVNQRVTIRLGAPYVTNCTNYTELWKKNGGYGSLTRRACTEKCKMESMIETEGCAAQTISYPEEYSICPDGVYPSDAIVEKCSQQCNEACKEVSYNLRQEVIFDQSAKCIDDANCKERTLFMNFVFNRLEIEKFEHHPRYESVEVFSYVGGYMGMWLGISLISLFDLAETMVALMAYPLRKTTRKRMNSVVDIY
ncbi:uncharacterized protein LOC129962769 [Argiope bruennichi]|uniref:uncharacterized protein LOC129962769 n=1 Tax=Argiope bruennichi TaxID=94029 RepID=UPI00249538FB|nr:uncharacterized protein LOC129962769 [Argiope bruennichi]